MARVKNTMELIEKSIKYINPRYDICTNHIMDIYNNNNNDPYSLIVNSFCFGYMQGMKAAKVEMKRINS